MALEIIVFLSIVAIIIIFSRHLPEIRKKFFDNQVENLPLRQKEKLIVKPQSKIAKVGSDSKLKEADELFKSRKFPLAEKIYIQLAAQTPTDAKIYNRLGALYLEQKNFFDAKSAFGEALKYDKTVASRWYNLGLACLGLQEFRNALDAFDGAVKIEKNNQKYQKILTDTKNQLKKLIAKK